MRPLSFPATTQSQSTRLHLQEVRDVGGLRVLILPEAGHAELGLEADARQVGGRLAVHQIHDGVALVAATPRLMVRRQRADDLRRYAVRWIKLHHIEPLRVLIMSY